MKAKWKRSISLLLTLVLCASLALPSTALAADSSTDVMPDDASISEPLNINPNDAQSGDDTTINDNNASGQDTSQSDPQVVESDNTEDSLSSDPEAVISESEEGDPAEELPGQALSEPAGQQPDADADTIQAEVSEQGEEPENALLPELTLEPSEEELPGASYNVRASSVQRAPIMPFAVNSGSFTSTTHSGSSLITNNAKTVNTGTEHFFNGSTVAYCFAHGYANPSGQTMIWTGQYASSQVAAILDHGYPQTTVINGVQLTDNQARQATQAAIWAYTNAYNRYAVTDLRSTGRAGADEAYAAADYLINTVAPQGSNSKYPLYTTSGNDVDSGDWHSSGYQIMLVPVPDEPDTTVIHLQKSSTNPGITNGNNCYSLAGAVYGVYSDVSCTQLVTTITTDASGAGNSEEIAQGSYWLKEITPSPGYQLDGEVYPVTADSTEVTANVTEVPANDPMVLTLTKIAADKASDIPSLAGAQFTIRYYDGQYSSVDQLPATPTRTWVIETQYNSVARSYLAVLSDTYKVSGDPFYYNAEGTSTILPLGTITIQETKAPDGYTTEGGYINNTSGQTVSDSNGMVLLNITQNGLGGAGLLNGGNAYTKEDNLISGGVKIYKRDAETGANTPQGDATLANAQFQIINRTGRTISVNGGSYANGSVVYTGGTDATGLFQTSANLLPAGHYELREQTPPTGYTTGGTISREFDISQNGVIVDLTAAENSISNEVIRGGVKLYKYDAETQEHASQGGATVQGAVFEIVNQSANAVVVNGISYAPGQVVYTGSTNASGLFQTASDLLPYGHYLVREATPPTGYTGDGTISQVFSIEQDGVVVNLTDFAHSISNEVIRGGVKLYKYDADTQEHKGQGGATVAGAKFEIVNRTGKDVVVNDVTYANDAVVYTGYTDDDGLFETAADLLPYGHYEVREATPPSGYTSNGVTTQEFDITQDGVVVDLTDFEHSISNRIIRGDFELRKVDGDFQTAMANVLFKITNDATGESHYFVTDDNGYFSSSASWIPHTQDTNGGNVDSGLWFGDSDPDDAVGALPYGTYTIEEQPCEANQDYILWTGTVIISRDNVTINLNNVENFQMRMSTSAVFESTNSQWGPAENGTVVIDTVRYENLLANTDYTIVGTVVDPETGAVLTDGEGNPISVTREFTTTTRSGSLRMEFVLDGSALAGQSLVICQTLYLGHGEAMSAEPALVHADLADEEQTVHFPSIDTNATTYSTGTNVSYADNPVRLTDNVSYSNLQPGRNYLLTGALMDAETGLPVYDANGNPITANISFLAYQADGTVSNTFVFDGSIHAGKTLVVYETLSLYNTTYASHTDLTDLDQTVYIPEIGTTALDVASETHNAMAGPGAEIVDTVEYAGLKPDVEYSLEASLVDPATGDLLKDASGTDITANATFTPASSSGSVEVTFRFDATGMDGVTGVVLEHLYLDGHLVADHTDLTDKGQTIQFPKVETTATDNVTGGHMGDAVESVTITDTVAYSNLIVGQEYTVSGVLYNKNTGEPLVDASGAEITATETFTAEKSEGTIDLTFTFDASLLAGETVVAFETLYTNDVPVGVHADIEDEDQSVHFPEVHTSAIDSETETDLAKADGEITIVDTVHYANVLPGEEYTVNGTLMDAETGEALLDANGKEITASSTFTAESSDGTVDVTFVFDGSNLAGRTLVVYESLTWKGIQVGSHTDLEDAGQTVHMPKLGTTALDSETDDHLGMADQALTILDTVSYENLVVGKTYTMTGTLYVKSTGEALLDAQGNPVTVSAEFTPEQPDGSVDLSFTIDASALAGESVVAFESLAYNGVEIAIHADIDDEGQTVHIPEIGTTAIDAESGTHNAMADETVTIVDTVEYTNLLSGKEYTVSGVLYNKATGEPLLDEDGEEITASTTFTAESDEGSVDITFTLDGSLLAGESVVAFETVTYQGVDVAVHADIDDEEQTIHFPKVHTTATEQESGEHITKADESVTIQDVVAYENLIPGQSYTMSGVLMNAATGEVITNSNGAPVTAETEFVAEAATGTVTMTFTLDASVLAGQSAVAFETLYTNGAQVAIHADLDDEGQTVHFPEVHTTATDSESGDHTSIADSSVTILDEVNYSNLIVGEEYTVDGTLYVKSTGEALLDAQGNPVTASTTFTAEETNGNVTLVFIFDASALAGETVVAFESLSHKGIEVGVHADINDESQSIHFPKIQTTAVDQETGSHEATADNSVVIIDTVTYTNLQPGRTYTLVGSVMDKATGEVLMNADGSPVAHILSFAPEAADGQIQLAFTFDASALAGHDVVVFESLYDGDNVLVQPVAEHADLNDEGQTVKLVAPPVPPTSNNPRTGDNAPVLLTATLLLSACAALAALWLAKNRRKDNDTQQ